MKNFPLAEKCITCNNPIFPVAKKWRTALFEKCVTPIGKIEVPHIPAKNY